MSQINRYLCFNLGKEEFAIPLLNVKEVIGVPDLTPIPQSPNYFLGIMNLRGLIISVLDLRIKLGIKPLTSDETTVIILDLGNFNLGIMVDRVNAVVQLSDSEINPKPVVESSKVSESITGVFRKNENLILLLNIAKALSLEDKNIVTKSSQAA